MLSSSAQNFISPAVPDTDRHSGTDLIDSMDQVPASPPPAQPSVVRPSAQPENAKIKLGPIATAAAFILAKCKAFFGLILPALIGLCCSLLVLMMAAQA